MQFEGLLAFGMLLVSLAAILRLLQRAFPESRSPVRKDEQPLIRRYLAFESAENGLLVVPFLIVGTGGIVVGGAGLLLS
ncbi:MAG: hypothetical protein M3198_15580 [Actinomycetota bacterium]|nr:hypothetical protein [Actinomycetota bacterium]